MHTIDPDYLPVTEGTLERFLVNHHGELDGMLLDHDVEVHFPPHLGDAVEALAKPGDLVRVRGVRPRGALVIDAVQIENALGSAVTDAGPPKYERKIERDSARRAAHERRQRGSCSGTIARVLHGPKGETRGALLEDGTNLRWPGHEAERISVFIRVGTTLDARGDRLGTPFGDVFEISSLGPSEQPVWERKPKAEHDRDADGARDGGA